MYRFLILFLALVGQLSLHAQCDERLGRYGTSFSTIDADRFAFLDEPLQDIQILGYGEDTHGTAEFTQLAGELFMYMVREHGYRTLIIEDAVGAARRMDDYLQGRGEARDALWDGNWRYYTEEFVTLLDQLRAYNREHPNDPVRIYGPEMQYVDTDAEYLEAYLRERGTEIDLSLLTDFATIWNQLGPGQLTDLFILTAKLERLLKDEPGNTWSIHHLNVIKQYLTAHYQTDPQRKHDFRELYMFQNIQWIMERSPEGKAMFWVHNYHAHDGLVNGTADAVGHHLRKAYGDRYFALGTDVGGGTVLAHAADANQTGQWGLAERELHPRDSTMLTSCLAEWGGPHYFVDFRSARLDPALDDYVRQHFRSLSGAGAQVRSYPVEEGRFMQAFDGMVYVGGSTALRRLD